MFDQQSTQPSFSRRRLLKLTGGTLAATTAFGGTATATSDGKVTFDEPTRINPPGNYGYEPSVNVDSYGTVYVTAHKASVTNEDTRLSSWFWYSADGGETWYDMPSGADVDNDQYALEGHIAVDDTGTVYFVDTYAGDNHINRWQTEPSGPKWDLSKPVMGTTGVDDRPWLRAHGDGIVYYLGNNGTSVSDSDLDEGRIWFYRSTDGGLTWSAGDAIPTGNYCTLAPSDADDQTVYVASPAGSKPDTFDVFASNDRGRTWTRDTVGRYEQTSSDPFPAWSVTDEMGNPYHIWIDDDNTDATPGTVNFTCRDGTGSWETLDVTPFDGTFSKPWIGAGTEGTVALFFYGSKEVDLGNSTEWYPYVLTTTDAIKPNPKWELDRLTDEPAGTNPTAPGHMSEVVIDANDRIHATFQRELDSTTLSNPTRTYSCNIFYSRGTIDK